MTMKARVRFHQATASAMAATTLVVPVARTDSAARGRSPFDSPSPPLGAPGAWVVKGIAGDGPIGAEELISSAGGNVKPGEGVPGEGDGVESSSDGCGFGAITCEQKPTPFGLVKNTLLNVCKAGR